MHSAQSPNIEQILTEKPLAGTERKILFIIIASIFSTALFTVFIFSRYLIYDFNDRLENRSRAVFSFLLNRIPLQSITELNSLDDTKTQKYLKVRTLLDGIRKTASVRYLYTTKRGNDGHPIYIVDGLPPDSEDFRTIGAPIEEEILPMVNKCLNGQAIHRQGAMSTSWGSIIPACEPIKQGEITVGALVIEFDVQSFVDNTRRSTLICLGFSFIVAIFVTLATTWLLKKLSAPLYRKLAYTDLLTGVLNRNAFELDIRYLASKENERLVVLSCDINLLKTINDQAGHAAGDAHIRTVAHLLHQNLVGFGQIYRIGGDEFIALLKNISIDELEERMNNLIDVSQHKIIKGFPVTFAFGMAEVDPTANSAIHEALKRADLNMYEHKKKSKQSQNNFQPTEIIHQM